MDDRPVVEKELPTERTVRLRLHVEGRQRHRPGQHYLVRLRAPDDYTAQRSYSVASDDDDPLLELLVERFPDGEVSTHLADVAEVGDVLEVRGPIGRWFTWDARTPALALVGGTGVVPAVSMLRTARRLGRRELLRVVAVGRSPDHLPYRDELRGTAPCSPTRASTPTRVPRGRRPPPSSPRCSTASTWSSSAARPASRRTPSSWCSTAACRPSTSGWSGSARPADPVRQTAPVTADPTRNERSDGREEWVYAPGDDTRMVGVLHLDDDHWQVDVAAAEFVRAEPLESRMRQAVIDALTGVPGVEEAYEEDRECWTVIGSPSGEALVRAVAATTDALADDVQAHLDNRS